jgi:hypothetical protein
MLHAHYCLIRRGQSMVHLFVLGVFNYVSFVVIMEKVSNTLG